MFILTVNTAEIKSLSIKHCPCSPAPLRLLSMGLFPCTPTAPSLAVDLNVLDFCRGLFLRVGPNSTAWCDALESFLDARSYKLTTRVSCYFLPSVLFTLILFYSRTRFGDASKIASDGTPVLLVLPADTSKI